MILPVDLNLTLAFLVGASVLTGLATGLIRRQFVRKELFDLPNNRSSHVGKIPRGGGLAIVLSVLVTVFALHLILQLDGAVVRTFMIGGLAVAAAGFIDDHRGLTPLTRLFVHAGSACLAIYWVGSLGAQPFGSSMVDFGWLGVVVAVVGMVWMLNLFNFMDGIDGIAASEGAFVCGAAAILIALHGNAEGSTEWLLLIGQLGACIGFLVWNWAPARIFMGDVGSGFLGYSIPLTALVTINAGLLTIWPWIILASLFIGDATVTLIRRAGRKEKWHQPHRVHAYQWLSRRWGSHSKVVQSMLIVNIVTLFPMAYAAMVRPDWAAGLTLAALGGSSFLAYVLGAGRPEHDTVENSSG